MSLIKCPECEKEISNLAEGCPHCGCPNSQFECNSLEQEDYEVNKTEYDTVEDEITILESQQENVQIENIVPEKKKKSKAPIILTVIFSLIITIILIIFVIIPYVHASDYYNSGLAYMEEGKYQDAFDKFDYANAFVTDYKDAEALAVSCVQKLMDEKNYTDAFDCITYNEDIAKQITVKEEDYADLGAFIDERLISAFSKSRYEVHQDSIACYAIAANEVLPNDYGNVKAYINIGIAVAASYAEFSDDEDFFISVSSLLCDTLKNNSEIDILKRILEQDSLIYHFISGETPEKRFEDTTYGYICTWYEPGKDSHRQWFLHGIGDGGSRRIGSWDDYESPEYDEAEYYHLEKATYYCSFGDTSREAVPQFTITINSYSNITIKSCVTKKTMTLVRLNDNFWE